MAGVKQPVGVFWCSVKQTVGDFWYSATDCGFEMQVMGTPKSKVKATMMPMHHQRTPASLKTRWSWWTTPWANVPVCSGRVAPSSSSPSDTTRLTKQRHRLYCYRCFSLNNVLFRSVRHADGCVRDIYDRLFICMDNGLYSRARILRLTVSHCASCTFSKVPYTHSNS